MKLKSLLFAVCLGLVGHAIAANQHVHPKANEANDRSSVSKPSMLPGYCEIEIINDSYYDAWVSGMFDDGAYLDPFIVYSFGYPHYIRLYYYGYCHSGMALEIKSTRYPYEVLYKSWTDVQSTLRIVPYFANGINQNEHDKKVKVEVVAK